MTDSTVELPSNRKFGWFFTFVFALAASYFLVFSSSMFWLALLGGLSVATLLLTLAAPEKLQPFNKMWALIGYWLGRIISPIILGLIYFILITPVALVTRLFGRDELRLKVGDSQSEWQPREPVAADSFRNQF